MTKPNCEAIAEGHLARQGYTPYCPRFKEVLIIKGKRQPIARVLFPRYIFILIAETWVSIRGTRGISHVLTAGDSPQVMPEREIARLRGRERNGLVLLPGKVNKFQVGDAVRAVSGPFANQLMIYDGMSSHERVWALIDFLGRASRVQIDERVLIPAA